MMPPVGGGVRRAGECAFCGVRGFVSMAGLIRTVRMRRSAGPRLLVLRGLWLRTRVQRVDLELVSVVPLCRRNLTSLVGGVEAVGGDWQLLPVTCSGPPVVLRGVWLWCFGVQRKAYLVAWVRWGDETGDAPSFPWRCWTIPSVMTGC